MSVSEFPAVIAKDNDSTEALETSGIVDLNGFTPEAETGLVEVKGSVGKPLTKGELHAFGGGPLQVVMDFRRMFRGYLGIGEETCNDMTDHQVRPMHDDAERRLIHAINKANEVQRGYKDLLDSNDLEEKRCEFEEIRRLAMDVVFGDNPDPKPQDDSNRKFKPKLTVIKGGKAAKNGQSFEVRMKRGH